MIFKEVSIKQETQIYWKVRVRLYFNRLLTVRVRVITQLAEIFWRKRGEIFHSLWF